MPTSSPPPTTPPPLSKRLTALVTDRLPLKAAAVFFALVLWLVASATQPSEQVVPVRFPLRLDSTLVLETPPPQVNALVIGSARDLMRLYANPPVISQTVGPDAPDTMTITLSPGDVQLPLGVEALVRDVQPRSMTLRFRSGMQRTLPIRSELRFRPPAGFSISGSPSFEPESVVIVGDRRRVARLQSIPTVASDLVVRAGEPARVALDTAELGVTVRPAQVRVTVPLQVDVPIPPASDSARVDSAASPP